MNADVKSLQELSFEVIRKEFSRYTTAYQLSEDEALKKNLCFLQRVYTQTLFIELENNKELKEEHFDFLLNKYLKKLDLGTLLSCSTKEKILEKVLPIAHSILELSSKTEYRHEEDSIFIFEKLIPLSNNVTKINIPYICNDDLLKLIGSSCPHLLELNIEDANTVTGDGIKSLCLNPDGQIQAKCPLKHLNISDTDLTVEDVAFILKNLPTLEEILYSQLPDVIESVHLLDIDNNIVSDTKQFNLQSLDFLQYSFNSSQLTKLLTLCTARCPKLRKLSVPIYNMEDLEILSRFSNLENLSILCFTEQDVIDLNSFLTVKGKDLKILTVDAFSLSASTLVENCPNLETLTLKNIQYQKLDKNSTKVLNRLHNLQLESVIFLDYHCTDSVMVLLNSSPKLENLSLLYCDFSESDIVAKLSTFSLNCNITHLQFDYSDVGVDLLQQFILNCNSIKALSLDNCENISLDDICMLNQTIEASNRKILISFTDDVSEFTYSDYEVDYDGDYDIDDYAGYDYGYDEDDYDAYDDSDDYDNGIHHDFW